MKAGMTLVCMFVAFIGIAPKLALAAPQKCPNSTACETWYWNPADWACDSRPKPDGTACNYYNAEFKKTESGKCESRRCVVTYFGDVEPKFLIATVIYAPPGNNGSTVSRLVYKSGESFGMTTTLSDSFTHNLNVEADTTFGNSQTWFSLNLNVKYSNEWGSSNTEETDISMSFNEEKVIVGDGYTGIDHNYDQIYVFLNPKVKTAITNYGKVRWALGTRDNELMFDLPLYVGEMTGALDWDPGTKDYLDEKGYKPSHYETILSANPFSKGSTIIDGTRFRPAYEQQLGNTYGGGVYPYRPTLTPQLTTVNITKAKSTKTTKENHHTYSVDTTISGSVEWCWLFSSKLKVQDKLTWSNSNTSDVRGSSTSGVTLQFPPPPQGYTGPLFLAAYVDTVYKTYLFQTLNP